MSISVRKHIPTPLELQYEEMKKQSAIERNENQSKNARKELKSPEIDYEVMISSAKTDVEYMSMAKPSEPVTPDEMQALRTSLSVFV